MRSVLLGSVIAAAPALFATSNALADNQEGFYVGGGVTAVDANFKDEAGNAVDYRTAEIFGGYKMNNWLGGEIRAGFSATKEDVVVETDAAGIPTSTFEFAIDHYEGIYLRADNANQVAKIYGLLGYASVSTSADDPDGGSTSRSNSGFSYGGGIGFVLDQHFNLNFEVKTLINTDDTEYTSFGITVDYRL